MWVPGGAHDRIAGNIGDNQCDWPCLVLTPAPCRRGRVAWNDDSLDLCGDSPIVELVSVVIRSYDVQQEDVLSFRVQT